jgi:hypothetical protein
MSVSISVDWAVLDFYEDPLVVSVFGKALGVGGGGYGYFQNNGAFTPDVKSVLNENLDGILGGTQC